jgi:uncharacterized membrane protein YfhO
MLETSSIQADFQTPVIEGASSPPTDPRAPQEATFLRDGERSVSLAVDARAPGYLTLSDTWYPGWTATVDGRAVAIRHANVAFRAVPVPAGHHIVDFAYSPLSARLAALASLLAALGIAAVLLIAKVRSNVRPTA